MTDSERTQALSEAGIPASCDCVWTVGKKEDGIEFGSIFIASKRCQEHLMHPRSYTLPPLPAQQT